jgi:arabinofuranosyltransferase
MPLSRLYMPIVAPIIVLSFEAAIELTGLAHPAGPSKGRGGFVCAVLLSLIALSGFLPSLNPRRPPYSHAIQHKALVERWTLAGRWLRQNTSSGTLLATDAAGAIPFYSGLKTIDMLGVNDRHIAHLSVPNMGHGTAGHEKRDFAYVLSRRPDIIFRDVRDQPCGAERMRTYPDGSVYGAECASLGPGPQASEFGEIAYKPLFIWYEKRQYPEPR